MANHEDECDSSSLFPVASQSDVTSFLDAQAAKITGLNSNLSDDDDDECSIDGSLLTRFTQLPSKTRKKTNLSQSCFASISNSIPSDDLTELKWLNTFKLKEIKDHKNPNNQDQINKLTNELKFYNHDNLNTNSISFDVLIFLALYSKSNDQQTPWSLTVKHIYEYVQTHTKQIATKRGWKNLLKQTLMTNPCFITTKYDILKSRSVWTIDPYYRPLLTRAYLTRVSLQSKK
jgi:alpha-acetolactate decarboxylase